MTDLRPCPFCGSEARLESYEGREHQCHYVQCPVCKIGTQVMFAEEDVVAIWNRRTRE